MGPVSFLPLATIGMAWLISAAAFAVAMSGTPGPNNTMLASSGSMWGLRRTIPHMLGVSVGFPLMIVIVAAGAGGLLVNHPAVLTVMRWIGAAYLLFLAAKIALSGPHPPDIRSDRPFGGHPLSFWQAALFQWVNPKAWLITLSALATLTSTGHHPSLSRAIVLAALFLIVALMTTTFWTSVGVGASRLLNTPRALRAFNLALAALLVASVISVLTGLG